jgi:hypothetical protein
MRQNLAPARQLTERQWLFTTTTAVFAGLDNQPRHTTSTETPPGTIRTSRNPHRKPDHPEVLTVLKIQDCVTGLRKHSNMHPHAMAKLHATNTCTSCTLKCRCSHSNIFNLRTEEVLADVLPTQNHVCPRKNTPTQPETQGE